MPTITINIDDQQEAKIIDLIDSRKHFRIIGGTVQNGDGEQVFLTGIEFRFHEGAWENTPLPKNRDVIDVEREGRLQRN